MPPLGVWVEFLHVATAFWFVSGLVGRNLTLRQAAGASDMPIVSSAVVMAGRFEKLMVIPGSIAVLLGGLLTAWAKETPWFADGAYWLLTSLVVFAAMTALVPLIFLPRGRVFEAALEEAVRRDEVTPELTAAFRDRAVWAARTIETLGVAFILSMMVLKPF